MTQNNSIYSRSSFLNFKFISGFKKTKLLFFAGFVCFWLLWISYWYKLKATSSARSWNHALDGYIIGLFNKKTRKRCIWPFWFPSDIRFILAQDSQFVVDLGRKVGSLLWFSRSYGVKWHLMCGAGRYLAPSTLLLSPLLLMLDIPKSCLEGNCKPQIAHIWLKSGTQNPSAGKQQPPPAQPWGFRHSHSHIRTYMIQWCPEHQMLAMETIWKTLPMYSKTC